MRPSLTYIVGLNKAISARAAVTIISLAVFTVGRDRDSDSEDCYVLVVLLWSPYVIGLYFHPVSSSFFFLLLLFFPRLISAVGDWMFTILWHMVWP